MLKYLEVRSQTNHCQITYALCLCLTNTLLQQPRRPGWTWRVLHLHMEVVEHESQVQASGPSPSPSTPGTSMDTLPTHPSFVHGLPTTAPWPPSGVRPSAPEAVYLSLGGSLDKKPALRKWKWTQEHLDRDLWGLGYWEHMPEEGGAGALDGHCLRGVEWGL